MKKLLAILVLSLLWSSTAYGLDKDTCGDYAAKAKSDTGAGIMYGVCKREEGTYFYNRSKEFKCAQKAAKASTNKGAGIKYGTCIRD